jgi:hypothetical protein
VTHSPCWQYDKKEGEEGEEGEEEKEGEDKVMR